MKNMEEYIAGIDLGSNSINVALASCSGEDINYRYLKTIDATGIEKGQVTDINLLSDSIIKVIDEISSSYDVNKISWNIGINNKKVKWNVTNGISYINNGYGVITQDEINESLLKCQENANNDNEKIINTSVINYTVDGIIQDEIPLGKSANELNIEAICFSISNDEYFNIKNALRLAGINKFNLYVSSYVLNDVVVDDSTKGKNIVMVDVGSDLTNIFQFNDNKLIYMDSIPIGGQSITNDLSICGKISLAEAEEIKINCSSRYKTLFKQNLVGENIAEDTVYDVKLYNDVIEARIEQLVELIKDKLSDNNSFTDVQKVFILGNGIVNFEKIGCFIEDILKKKVNIISNNELKLLNYSDINSICLVKNAVDRLKLNQEDNLTSNSNKDDVGYVAEDTDNKNNDKGTIVSKIKKVLEYIF